MSRIIAVHGSFDRLGALNAQDATASSSIASSVTAEKISPAKTRRADKFDRYAWRDNVFADTATPQNAKCLAFGIAKHINGETGEAYPSTRKLAEVCGMSKAWVCKTIAVLRSAGWIDVELGSRGRGEKHCNRFRINPEKRRGEEIPHEKKRNPAESSVQIGHEEKDTPCALLAEAGSRVANEEQHAVKGHFSPLKGHPVCPEPLNPKEELKDRVPL